MKQIKVNNQKELDKIKIDFEGEILIVGNIEILNRNFSKATVYVSDNATIQYVYGNATIQYVYGNATIQHVSDNATILMMTGLAVVTFLYSAKKIVAKGLNVIRQIGDKKLDIEISKSVKLIKVTETIEKSPDFKMYQKLYPTDVKNGKVILYKSVHKVDGKYLSDYSGAEGKLEYKIGETTKDKCDKSKERSCSYGLHVSHKIWAINFGSGWGDVALLECEVPIKNIVVSKDCDGKVRTSELKVLREVPKEEWFTN